MGTPEAPAGSSLGAHALTRTLPAGSAAPFLAEPVRFAHEIAVTTHAVEAANVATAGASIVANLVGGAVIERAVTAGVERAAVADPALPALAAGSAEPADRERLRSFAPDARAISALTGAVYAVASYPERERIRDALAFAASPGDGGHVTAAAGAFLGAAHGVEALPVDWLSRLELGWVGEVLVQDLITEFTEGPSGSEYEPASDDIWFTRYPG
jgi:hypothetical protein